LITKPKLPIVKRFLALLPNASALLDERSNVISGVIEISLRRYMPSPAGLMAIDERSAPSEVKAPAIAIERALP
jgi:hypothetical protein